MAEFTWKHMPYDDNAAEMRSRHILYDGNNIVFSIFPLEKYGEYELGIPHAPTNYYDNESRWFSTKIQDLRFNAVSNFQIIAADYIKYYNDIIASLDTKIAVFEKSQFRKGGYNLFIGGVRIAKLDRLLKKNIDENIMWKLDCISAFDSPLFEFTAENESKAMFYAKNNLKALFEKKIAYFGKTIKDLDAFKAWNA